VKPLTRVVVLGSCAVLTYTTMAATASVVFGISYDAASVVSCLIYLGAGFAGACVMRRVADGARAGAAVGFVDATLGWVIASLIGPGRLPAELGGQHSFVIAAIIVAAVAIAGVIGLLGGAAAKAAGFPALRPHPPVGIGPAD
jgi:hypothetical protein